MEDLTQMIIIEAILSDIHVAEAVLIEAGMDLDERRKENAAFIAYIKSEYGE